MVELLDGLFHGVAVAVVDLDGVSVEARLRLCGGLTTLFVPRKTHDKGEGFMEPTIVAFALVALGGFTLVRAVLVYARENGVEKFVRSNRKAQLWVKMVGEDRAVTLTRYVFLPLGCIIGTLVLLSGLHQLMF